MVIPHFHRDPYAQFFWTPFFDGDMTVPHSSYSSHFLTVAHSTYGDGSHLWETRWCTNCIQGWHCRSTTMAQWLYMIFDPSRPSWEGSAELFAENSPVVPCGFGVDFDVLRFGNSRLLCPQMAFDELLGSRCEKGWRVIDGEIETSRSLRGHYTL